VIAMLGNVFSPYYAAARKRGPADPLDFVTMNVALYGPSSRRWALTERRGAARAPSWLSIGPSSIRREDDAIVVDVDEVTAPLATRLRGRIVLEPIIGCGRRRVLAAAGNHAWWPIAPRARVRVEMTDPEISWSGSGYFDANAGDEPLEDGFESWHWSRLPTPRGAVVSYAVQRRDGSRQTLDLAFDEHGSHAVEALSDHTLPPTSWRIPRTVRAPRHVPPGAIRTLEDTPFYARSVIEMRAAGHTGVAVHESLSLDRFRSRWVRALLPMRIRRVRA